MDGISRQALEPVIILEINHIADLGKTELVGRSLPMQIEIVEPADPNHIMQALIGSEKQNFRAAWGSPLSGKRSGGTWQDDSEGQE